MWETNPWSHVKAKRNYHVFHAKPAILVLMWKKKNKQSISLSPSLFLSHGGTKKHNNGPSLFSFTWK